MHRATAEASQLRRSLSAILTHPDLGPLAKPIVAGQGTPDAAGDKKLADAYKSYKEAPDDETAFRNLLKTARELSREDVLSDLTGHAVDAENTQRLQQRKRAVGKAINDHVVQIAPDVNMKVFWQVSRQAMDETPIQVTDPAERIEWQMNRAIQLSRELVKELIGPASAAASEAAAIQHAAGAVMPAGHAAPGAPPAATPEQPLTFAEQAQRNKVRIGPA